MKNKPAKKIFEDTDYSIKKCDEKGCEEDGNFVAPKSPNSSEKYFFCLKVQNQNFVELSKLKYPLLYNFLRQLRLLFLTL